MRESEAQAIKKFIETDIRHLALSLRSSEEFDARFVVEQIDARQRIRRKLPDWYKVDQLVIPSRLASEQCSSQSTAAYKATLMRGDTHTDLTGGLGVDCFYFAQQSKKSIYVEQQHNFCEAAQNNFALLGSPTIQVICADAIEWISQQTSTFDTLYLDPARRDEANKRIFSLADCLPDVTKHLDTLRAHTQRLIIKASPMADIHHTVQELQGVTEVHILGVRNECKELLFVMDRNCTSLDHYDIQTWNETADRKCDLFTYRSDEEVQHSYSIAHDPTPGEYLLDPNTTLHKSGGYRTLAHHFNLQTISPNSHLFISQQSISTFPGRQFLIESILPFRASNLRKNTKQIKQANIAVRNFPLTVDEIRRRTDIAEGGECYLFATTLNNGEKTLIICSKIE